MGRKRDPKRDQAFRLWKNSDGQKKLTEIAEELGVSPGTVRGWKNKDEWDAKLDGTFHKKNTERSKKKKERSATEKKRGAPLGNKNAVGNKGGAPFGNQNGKGHGPPLRNTNALKTGEYKTFWREALDEEDLLLLEQQQHINAVEEVKEEILQYSLREMFIAKRIKAIKEGLPSSEVKNYYERRKVKVPVQIEDPIEGGYKTVYREDYDLVHISKEETVTDHLQKLLDHEEALTRIQDKKVKALAVLFEMTDKFEHKRAVDEIKMAIAQEKWALEKEEHNGESKESEQWASTLEDVFVKRKKKRQQAQRSASEVIANE
jgi:uncharacterized protein YjcR